MQTRRAFAPRARPARAPSQTRASPRARSRPRASIASRASIEFHFAITAQLDYGDSLALVGDADALGAWNVDRALELQWTDGNAWCARADVDVGVDGVAFKCVRRRASGDVEWEGGENKTVRVEDVRDAKKCVVRGVYGDGACAVTRDGGGGGGGGETREDARAEARDDDGGGGEPPSVSTSAKGWSGGEVRMMQSNEHTSDRPATMRWDVGNLEEASAARAVVLADESGGSWFEKLAAVANQIGIGKEITRDKLAVSATYLRWISTGTIKCVESGGHRRPNGPAMVGRGIFISMEQVQGAMYRHGTDLGEVERVVMRQVHPWLPSFNEEFTNAVPLTRIRDIAHRNDIPEDLKKTIKHTIQNKLHRNAGPEDLIATEVVLERITAREGEYSEDFVREFREFHRELKRFFNATGVFERLDSLRGTLDEETEPLIGELGELQHSLNNLNDGWLNHEGATLRHTLDVCTRLRSYFCAGLSTGMRNDAPDDSVRQRHAWRQVEMSLEEYAFVLLARCNNLMEREKSDNMQHAANVSALALKHIGLSGWKSLETGIIARELMSWTTSTPAIEDGNAALRLKATLQRARRLIESQTRAVMSGFGDAPAQLADAFGLEHHVGATFVESVIRASVAFQLSRTIEMMSEVVERNVDGDGFDPIVLGDAQGVLVLLDRLNPESVQVHGDKDIIAFVSEVDGDEEISSAGSNVKGVILRDELAHLSHLAIRARQERTPLVSALSGEARSKVSARVGKDTVLNVSSLHTELRDFDGTRDSRESGHAVSHAAVSPTACAMVNVMTCLPLAEATISNAGTKSSTCSRLVIIARDSAAFKAPSGFVVPFGSMEASIRDEERFGQLLLALESVSVHDIDDACSAIQSFIVENLPEREIVERACSALDASARLVVRSSANVEDLSGMSAAGLYESVVGIDAQNVTEVQRAIADVWASLYSRRAVLARRAAGVKQSEARMAVLAQELSPNALSFVLHTQSPIRGAKSVQAEVCVGLGETLASGIDGTPWRFEIDRATGAVDVLAYANHASSLRCRYGAPTFGKVKMESVDYSRQELSTNADARARLGRRLLKAAIELETALGAAQDVEGGVLGDDEAVIIVQSRPQPI